MTVKTRRQHLCSFLFKIYIFFSTKLNFKMGNSEVTVRGKFDVKKLWQRWIYFIYIHVCITVWIFNSFFEAWLTANAELNSETDGQEKKGRITFLKLSNVSITKKWKYLPFFLYFLSQKFPSLSYLPLFLAESVTNILESIPFN